MAAAPKISLDQSKPFSEVRGERTPDDPHYRVHFMQGRKVGKKIVLLPFDAQGALVPDDGKTEPYQGLNVESKQVVHQPLYNDDMRELVKRLQKRIEESQPEEEEGDDEVAGPSGDPSDDVNLQSWLKGDARYAPHLLRSAAKQRYHVAYPDEREMVRGLVLDEKLVPEDQVARHLAKHLKEAA